MPLPDTTCVFTAGSQHTHIGVHTVLSSQYTTDRGITAKDQSSANTQDGYGGLSVSTAHLVQDIPLSNRWFPETHELCCAGMSAVQGYTFSVFLLSSSPNNSQHVKHSNIKKINKVLLYCRLYKEQKIFTKHYWCFVWINHMKWCQPLNIFYQVIPKCVCDYPMIIVLF